MENLTDKGNFIFLNRDIPEWLKTSPICLHLLLEFARRARYTEGDACWNGEVIHLKILQFITGRIKVAQELGITEGEYRGAYRKLVKWGYIRTIKATKHYTLAECCPNAIFEVKTINALPSEEPSNLPSPLPQLTTNDKENNAENDISRLPLIEKENQHIKHPGLSSGYDLLKKRREELHI